MLLKHYLFIFLFFLLVGYAVHEAKAITQKNPLNTLKNISYVEEHIDMCNNMDLIVGEVFTKSMLEKIKKLHPKSHGITIRGFRYVGSAKDYAICEVFYTPRFLENTSEDEYYKVIYEVSLEKFREYYQNEL